VVSSDEAADPLDLGSQDVAGSAEFAAEFDAALLAGMVPSAASLDARSFLGRHELAWQTRPCEASLCFSTHAATSAGFDGEGKPRYYILAGIHQPPITTKTPPPQHYVFVVALGGTDAALQHRNVQAALVEILPQLRVEDRVSLVIARTQAEIVFEAGSPHDSDVVNSVEQYMGGTQSNTYDGLRRAYEAVARLHDSDAGAVPRVILLTDANVSTGIKDLSQIDALVAANGKLGIGTSAIGIGESDSTRLQFVQNLALSGGGQWRWLENGPSFSQALAQETARLWNHGVARASLRLRTTNAASVVESFGAIVANQGTDAIEVEIPFPHGIGDKTDGIAFVIFEVAPDSSGTTAIGELTLEYPEASSKLVTTKSAVDFPGSMLPILGTELFADESAERAFVALEVFRAFQRATLAAGDGARLEAVSELDAASLRLNAWIAAKSLDVTGEFAQDQLRIELLRANLDDQLGH
jgi:hypothetical protein